MGGPGPASGDLQQNGASKVTQVVSTSPESASPLQGDPMDITPTATNSMGPPVNSSPEVDPHTIIPNGTSSDNSDTPTNQQGNSLTAAAATSSSQPKMVNTAFIHKLYKYGRIILWTKRGTDVGVACWRIQRYVI